MNDNNNDDEELVFSSYDQFKNSIKNVESKKVFRLPDSHYQIYVTHVELEDRYFLSLTATKEGKYHQELYEVNNEELIEIGGQRKSKGGIHSEKDAAEIALLDLGFNCLEKWGGGI